jgi:2'-5' RNA ligase
MRIDSYEYLAVIKPDEIVTSVVMAMKTKCKERYGWNSAIYSKPHFTVINFIQPKHNHERLISCFERNMENISPFQINLCGFDYFTALTNTLYIKLPNQQEFAEMVNYVKKITKPILKSVPGYPPHYTKNAHLTIAKGILKPEFINAWPDWENVDYHATTNADGILLLRRPFAAEHLKYEEVDYYSFLGKGIIDAQTSLF